MYNEYSQEVIVNILKINEELNTLKDIDSILDRILYESRKISSADAGSIYLVEEDSLKFSFVHNDTLFSEDTPNAELYTNLTIPINKYSIVGYAALTGQTVVIDDVYKVSPTLPYSFNPSYDQKSGYKTKSMLTIPLKTFQNKSVGVIQLINAKNDKGESVPFSKESCLYVPLFANSASAAIEHGILNRELILRMMKMAELRDPHETGAHVQRVGAYSAEIFRKWAVNKGLNRKEIKQQKDLIRLAAMLHDVGKVGISDSILKKPAKLTLEEFNIIEWHTYYGAQLFLNNKADLDLMCCQIALNHHEKWEGGGYQGMITDEKRKKIIKSTALKGDNIPLAARITSLADVFDALGSKRSYKEPWTDEQILNIIDEDTGKRFDPEIVAAFYQIFDVIKAIRSKYRDMDED